MNAKRLQVLRGGGLALLAWLGLHGPLDAQDESARRNVEQKLGFVRQMLTDSPSAQRIAASGHPEALRQVEEGRQQFERAREALDSGDLRTAEVAANAAISALGRARKLVPDGVGRANSELARYRQLLSSAEKMVPTYRDHLARTGFHDAPDLSAAVSLIEQARAHAAADRLGEATRALLEAERHLLVGLNRTIADRTLVYAAHFDTPKLEFEYELDRFKSFVDLVPVALLEFRPAPDAQERVRRLVADGQGLRERALGQAAQQQYEPALASLRDATRQIQRALGAAGLVIPMQ